LQRVTGLIYVAIIAVWAIVLVPAWLRRHDHRDPQRSVDRFSRTMQTLGSRDSLLGIPLPGAIQDSPEARRDDAQPEVLRVNRPAPDPVTERFAGAVSQAHGILGRSRSRAAGTSAAARRRIVLGVLVAGLALTGVLVVAGLLSPIALAVPGALVVGFVGVARHQVVQARRRARARAARPPVASGTVGAAAPSARPVPGAAGSTWEARDTPLPTYVTAPRASDFTRVIDTETPGAWTAAAMLEQAQKEKLRAERMAQAKAEAIARAKAEQAAAEARSRDEEFLATQQAQWQPRRRAVNE
jgi:hypothetical protein